MAKRRQSISIQEEDRFKVILDEILEEINNLPELGSSEVFPWIVKIINYCIPKDRQLMYGRGVVTAYKSFVGDVDSESLKPIYYLGWCVELFASTFHIHEDIQRRNLTRQGKICWHLRDEVGKSAFNDIFLIQAIMHNVIDRHFKGKKVHKYIVALFHKCFMNTKLGQSMDGRLGSVKGFSKFTMDNYKALTKYKVGYFFFFLPIALGKILSDDEDPTAEEIEIIEDITLEMGFLFQVQDDFLDCFGNADTAGRYGTGIQGNRCSWFIVKALEKLSCEQEKVLKEQYGKPGKESVHRVIKVFRDLNLLQEYRDFEMKCYKSIMTKISNLPDNIPALYFSETLDLILKREK